jgi:hypothetical protein
MRPNNSLRMSSDLNRAKSICNGVLTQVQQLTILACDIALQRMTSLRAAMSHQVVQKSEKKYTD